MLALIPTEIVEQITSLLSGIEINRLWATGDHQLQLLMENGGVLRYEVVMQGFYKLPKWPSTVLGRLRRLTTLMISTAAKEECMPIADVQIASLSPTLTRLEVRSGELCFAQLLADTASILEDPPPIRLKDRFPLLQHLSIISSTTDWLLGAPDSLTVLKLETPRYPPAPLPSTLTDLELDILGTVDEVVPRLPQSLTRLSIHTKIHSLRQFFPLPTSLRVLQIADIANADIVDILPPDLEELQFSLSMDVIRPEEITRLPRSLRRLTLAGQYWGLAKLTPENISHLPPNLDTLHISAEVDCAFETLPRFLTKLTLTHLDEGGPALLAHLPACVTYLSLPLMQDLSDEDLLLLPPRLRTFKCPESFRITLTNLLPRSIERLVLYNVLDTQVETLPQGLVEFRLDSEWRRSQSPIFSSIGVSLLPSSLIFLSLTELILLEKQLLGFKWPPMLETLSISVGPKSQVSDAAVSLLPSSLTSLSIPGSYALTGACFKHLPKRLIELNLTSPFEFEESDLIHLPRSIARLELWHDELTNDCIPMLPPLLNEIYLHAPKMTEPALQDKLPHALTIRIFSNRGS